MARQNQSLPLRVTEARTRLERAVTAMEAIIEEQAAKGGATDAGAETLRAENRALREATEIVSERLDTAIDRLRAILKE